MNTTPAPVEKDDALLASLSNLITTARLMRGRLTDLRNARKLIASGEKIESSVEIGEWQSNTLTRLPIKVPGELVKFEVESYLKDYCTAYRKALITARDAICAELSQLEY